MSQGRAILGIGTGWFQLEHDQLGFEFGTFTDRFNRLDPAPPPATSTAAAPPPPTTPTGPRQVTYSVTGTKAPGDIISVTYVDASGRRRTQHNVYIPWSMTVTPISQSDVGSVEASSLFRVSRLNCSITTSDGTVLSSNSNDAPQTSC
ncbi:Membrane protein [Mycobacterium avium subsp. paratuberculosis]|nr:Membrane protein [Mycobacterium avium subsp. paratuberculosis]